MLASAPSKFSVAVRNGSPDAPGVRALIASYCRRYGVENYEPMTGARWHVAVDERGTAGAIAYIDTPSFRFVTDWYAARGRRGSLATEAFEQLVRTRPVVGWVTPGNRVARTWLRKRGGSETTVTGASGEQLVVAVYLPPEGDPNA